MSFGKKTVNQETVALSERRVSVTTRDLGAMGIFVPIEINVPGLFGILDRSISQERWPHLDNEFLESGEEVLLVAESEIEGGHKDLANLRLRLPGPYRYGTGDHSYGGIVDVDLAVETGIHRRNDLASRVPHMRSAHLEGETVFGIGEVVEGVGLPISVLRLEVTRYDVRGYKKDKNQQEKIDLEWAFREGCLVGVSLETNVGLTPGKIGPKTRDRLLVAPRWKFAKWGCGVYSTCEKGTGRREVKPLDKPTYQEVLRKLYDKGTHILFLDKYSFSKSPSLSAMGNAIIESVGRDLAPAAIRKVVFEDRS